MSKSKSIIEEELLKFIRSFDIDYSILVKDTDDYKKPLIEHIYKDFYKDTSTSTLDSSSKRTLTIKRKKQIESMIDDLIESFSNSCKRYTPDINNLNETIVEILKILIYNINEEVDSTNIYNVIEELDLSSNNKDTTKRALAHIKCLYMSDYIFRSRFNTSYKIVLDKWFNDNRRYYIHNKDILTSIAPLMVSYLRSDRGLDTDDLFEILESIIKEFSSPIESSSTTYSIEKYIYENIGEDITIIVKGTNSEFMNKTISPQRIFIDDNSFKNIEYIDNRDIIKTIPLSAIIDINDSDLTAKQYLINQSVIKEEETQIIIESNIHCLDFFLYKPLKNQRIYSRNRELLLFEELFNYEVKDNKFYVVANDTITNASAIVLKCLSEVKVITPTSLNDLINDKIQKHNSLS